MAELIPDTLDFSAYMRQTDVRVKVRPASAYADDVAGLLDPCGSARCGPQMISTKLRGKIEFRPGEVTAWAGYSGHRKSLFTGQLALDLCVQRERVLLASFEMMPATTLARMTRQALGSGHPCVEGVTRFSRWTDGRLWLFDHMGRISPAECLAVVRYFAEELKGTQVLIDSMMMVCASEEHLDEQKQFATDVVRAAQEYGVHAHVVCHCRKPASGKEDPPGKHDLRGSAAIADQAHNVITIWANKAKQQKLAARPQDEEALAEPDARVCIEKQRNGEFEGPVKLWFHPKSLRFLDDRTGPVEPYALLESPLVS